VIFFHPVIPSFPVFHAFSTMASSKISLSCSESGTESDVSMSRREICTGPRSRSRITEKSLSTIKGLDPRLIPQILALTGAKPKPVRKTPAGLVNIRQAVMQIMSFLRDTAIFSGQHTFLCAIYRLVSGDDTEADSRFKAGPMKSASDICVALASNEQIYEIWRNIATEYKQFASDNNLGRGGGDLGKHFFLNKTPVFIASLIILLNQNNCNFAIADYNIAKLAKLNFGTLCAMFRVDLPSASATEATGTCSAFTKKGDQCSRTGKVLSGGHFFCTQHAKAITA